MSPNDKNQKETTPEAVGAAANKIIATKNRGDWQAVREATLALEKNCVKYPDGLLKPRALRPYFRLP